MHACLARGENVDIAIAVEICDDELRPHSSRAVDRYGKARELAGLAVDFVVVDDERIIRSRIGSVMPAITLAGQKLRLGIAIDVRQRQRMRLRERFIDHMPQPLPSRPIALLL